MGRVLTNNTTLQVTFESSTGTLPAEPIWYVVEFSSITTFGATITSVARRPIGQLRGRRKGAVTDLDSAVEIETDLTVDAFVLFAEGFVFSEYTNEEFFLRETYGTPSIERPPRVDGTTEDFDIDMASSTLAAKVVFGTGFSTLLFTKGYANSENNGLHVLSADLMATETAVQVTTDLVTESTPPDEATCEFCGLRTDDVTLTIDSGLATGTLVSAADIDFTAVGITVGQQLHIGSADASGVLQNAPQISATVVFGYLRVTAVTATTVTFDKADPNLGLGGMGSSAGTETIDIMYGRFLRNVPVQADSTDNRYLERTFQFEGAYPGLAANGVDTEYEYAVGNFANELTFNLPLTALSTVTFGFIGTTSEDITGTRKNNAEDGIPILRGDGFATASNLVSITTDVLSSTSEVCFKSVTATILNNVSPEKCLGTLGAVFVNAGQFEVNIEAQMAFTNASIINAIRNNTTVTMAFIVQNENGAIALDIPEMTLSGGGREFPVDQTVLVNVTGNSFTSTTFGYDVGISLFANVPGVIA